MPIAPSAHVHPTAVIDPRADIGEEAQVGPHVVIEGEVRVGPGCVLRPGVHLIGPLTMGCHNEVYSHAVLGERPQHVKYAGEPTRVEVGNLVLQGSISIAQPGCRGVDPLRKPPNRGRPPSGGRVGVIRQSILMPHARQRQQRSHGRGLLVSCRLPYRAREGDARHHRQPEAEPSE